MLIAAAKTFLLTRCELYLPFVLLCSSYACVEQATFRCAGVDGWTHPNLPTVKSYPSRLVAEVQAKKIGLCRMMKVPRCITTMIKSSRHCNSPSSIFTNRRHKNTLRRIVRPRFTCDSDRGAGYGKVPLMLRRRSSWKADPALAAILALSTMV